MSLSSTGPKTPISGDILIVDDTPANLRLLSDMLVERGHKVRLAPNGKLALMGAQAVPPDLILLDIKMPGLSGYEVCEQLKADPRTRDIPVIFISALDQTEDKVKAFTFGGVDYVTKPFQLGEVLARVETHLALRAMQKQLEQKIAERVQAEEALKEYSERLEEMVAERTKELREAQEQLVRQERLSVLGQLAGGVGHELRNPLGAISNAAYFLNMVLQDPEPEVKEALEVMEKEVRACDRIISSLLDFARTKASTRHKVDVNDVLQAALSRITVPENVEVVSRLDESLPTILADPVQLDRIFENIILNASQAMPEGGRLVVKTAQLSLRAEPQAEGSKSSEVSGEPPGSEEVAISFADTGVGIPEENLAQIFEPLFTTKAKGIGLGLALVKMLVEANGGSIEVESEEGKGSTFTVNLPIGRGEEKENNQM